MAQEKVVINAVKILDELGIPYMLTGAIAVNYYGMPRLTHDADIVVELIQKSVNNLVKKLRKEFYIDEQSVGEAIEERTVFNAVHNTGFKIDFWMLKETEYDSLRFKRKVRKKIFGKTVCLTSPEDLIIKKLEWYKEHGLDKDFYDAVGVYEIQEKLDMIYIRKWVNRQGTAGLFKRVRAEAMK
jgi:hypothetical protein